MSPGWGWTPPGGAGTPGASANPANGLQPIVDAIAAAGSAGVIELPAGTYYADPASPSTPLTIPSAAFGMSIVGTSAQVVFIGSPILIETGRVRLAEVHIDPPAGAAYGVKVYNGGSPFISRCTFDRIIIGDLQQVRANGPTKGLHLDGAGIIQASNCTFAFCSGDGLYVDSTGTEPNTALQFDMCSFVGNGGYGIRLLGSCSIAEFRGGNSEQNTSGELKAESMNNLILNGFDFESTSLAITHQCEINSCRPVTIRGCNFVKASPGSVSGYPIIMSSCQLVTIEDNAIAAFPSQGIIRMDVNCGLVRIANNWADETSWLEDYST